MILLTEAIERYSLAAGDHGIRVSRRRRTQTATRALAAIDRRLAPLRLPAELHALWANWSPQSFGPLFFDGLYSLADVERVYDRDAVLGFPRACVPVANIEKAGVWVELATPDHPGGRVYHTFYDDGQLQLWCVDLSTLIHLVAETIERGGVKDPESLRPWLDVATFDEVRLERTAELLAMPDEWRVPVDRPDAWPAHWADAQNKVANPPEEIDLRARATHTVADFDDARSRSRVTAILHGRITGTASGGPVDGLIVSLTDDSGTIQAYVSGEVERSIAELDPARRVEVEVLGEPTVIPSAEERTFLLRRNLEDLSIGHLRLLSQMRKLDVTAAVLKLRPLD